jgi:hypothetical protein
VHISTFKSLEAAAADGKNAAEFSAIVLDAGKAHAKANGRQLTLHDEIPTPRDVSKILFFVN